MPKLTRFTLVILAAGLAVQLHPPTASAATFYWDTLRTGGAGGGTGAWDLSALNWATATTGGSNAAWTNGSDATFSGTPGVATLGGAISVGRLTFTTLTNTITTTNGNALTITNGITANISTTRSINTITGAGGLVVNGNQTIDLTNGLNISTVLSGSGTLTKSGTGAVGLSVANTYTGKFVVTGGFLGISLDAALGVVPTSFQADAITLNGGGLLSGGVLSGPGNFNDPGSFALDANRGITLGSKGGSIRVGYGPAGTLTVNGVISGVGALNKLDGGNLILNADNTYQGGTTITAGVLQVGSGGTTGKLGAGTITFGSGTGNFLNFNRSTDVTISDDVVATGRANISAVAGMTVTLDGAVTGPGELWTHGAGTIVVSGNARSSRTTNTVIEGGTLQVSDLTRTDTSALGSGLIGLGQGSSPSTGAGLRYTGDSVSTDAIQLKSQYGFIDVANVATTLTLTASLGGNLLTKRGEGALSLGGDTDNTKLRAQVDAGVLLLAKGGPATSHAIAGADALILNNGVVRITGSNGDQIYDPSTIQMNGGTLDLNGHDEAFDGFTSSAAGAVITNTSGTPSKLTLGANNGSSVYSGKLQDGGGNLALQKIGTGALTLAGTNTLTGGTTVANGRLIVTGSLTGNTQVMGDSSSGKYVGGVLGGSGAVGNITTFGGIVAPGTTAAGAGLGTLRMGTLDLSSNGTLDVAISTSTLEASLAQIQGNLSLGFSAAALKLTNIGTDVGIAGHPVFTILSYTGTWDGGTFSFGLADLPDDSTFIFGANTFRIDYNAVGSAPGTKEVTLTVVVPEPAAGGMFAMGLTLLGLHRRRKLGRHLTSNQSLPS